MSMKQSLLCLTCLCFGLGLSFSVNNLEKCGIKDNACIKNLYQNLIKEVGKSGIPELNIPSLDPIALKNVTVGVDNFINITLVDGIVKGLKDCVVNKYEIDIDKGTCHQEISCNFIIKGHYSLFGDSDFLKQLLGNSGLRGDGKGKVKLEKLVLNMKYSFYPEKHDDGEIYFKGLYKSIEYDYEIKDKASFSADKIFIGKENISEFVVKYLNENWKYVLQSFGRSFVDKALEYYIDFAEKFFDAVPAKKIIIDDLTPYLKD